MFIRSGYRAHTRSDRSGIEHHHRAADVLVGGRDLDALRGPQPAGRPFALERAGVELVEADEVLLGRELATGADRLPHALEDEPVAGRRVVASNGDRAAAVD